MGKEKMPLRGNQRKGLPKSLFLQANQLSRLKRHLEFKHHHQPPFRTSLSCHCRLGPKFYPFQPNVAAAISQQSG
jgi:hypothetical protein